MIRVFSWALYDLANTIFAMSILSLYGTLEIKAWGGTDLDIGIANAVIAGFLILLLPSFGGAADVSGRRKGSATVATLVCIGFTASMSFAGSWLDLLILWSLARIGYQIGLVMYEAMLPDVAGAEDRMARVSGIGTGLGYAGSFIVVALIPLLMHKPEEIHRDEAFLLTAAGFLIFAFPFFLLVRDRRPAPMSRRERWRAGWKAFRGLGKTFRDAASNRPLRLYLIAAFLFLDAVQTVILFMGIFLNEMFGLTDEQVRQFMLGGVIAAGVGSVVIGWLADRIGPGRALQGVLVIWILALSLTIRVEHTDHLWMVSVPVGIAMGGTWTACRPVLLLLAPKERRSEFYGVYGIVSKGGELAGPLIWGTITALVPGRMGYQYALGAMMAFVITGLLLLPREAMRKPAAG